MANRRMESSNYRNPCLTMHQPWASLLVYGIKRIEGRSWPAPIRGRLWIHAAGKVPEPETIKAMEDFYREIYALNGITDIKFPEHYPVSRLLGCIDVVGCVTCEELVNWEAMPESVRLEGQTALCWLCERPQRLIVPFEMRGFQGVYNLERKIYEGAVRGISSVKPPQPVSFPLPNPRDPFSLKPGSLASLPNQSGITANERPPSLVAAVAGARAAATQFSKNHSPQPPKVGRSLPNSEDEKAPSLTQLSLNHSPQTPEVGATLPNRVSESERPPSLVTAGEALSKSHTPQPRKAGSVDGSKRPVLARTSKEWVRVQRLVGGSSESSLATKGV